MTCSEKIQELQTVADNLLAIAQTVILENKELLINAVIDQQYNQSVDSTGAPLRAYSHPYMLHKELAGKYRGKTDFDDTGEFHGAFNVAINDETYYIESSSTDAKGELKSEILEAWQGAPVMDLTPENIIVVREQLTPLFRDRVNEAMG